MNLIPTKFKQTIDGVIYDTSKGKFFAAKGGGNADKEFLYADPVNREGVPLPLCFIHHVPRLKKRKEYIKPIPFEEFAAFFDTATLIADDDEE